MSSEPSDQESVAAAEAAVRAALAGLDIAHEALPCDPALADTAAFCEHYGVDAADSANTIVVVSKRPKGKRCACLLLADSRLDVNKRVTALLGVKRASFAGADVTRELTGQMIGGVTVFGLPEGLPIYVDARVMTRASIVVGGGSRSLKLRLAPAELRKLAAVQVVEDLAIPRA